jgi:transposase
LAAISESKKKTDRNDARTLAQLLAAGVLEGSWLPDEQTRALRRRVSRRHNVVVARTRAKNEAMAVLHRNLAERPPMSDPFGVAGRRWLGSLDLPDDEVETLSAALRQIDFLGEEIATLERALARFVAGSAEAKRLMSVPGVAMITAATFLAQVGEIDRFSSPKQLVGYLGLDPRVRQSGNGAAFTGRISKEGSVLVPPRHGRVRALGDPHAWAAAGLPRAGSLSSPPPARWWPCSGTCSPGAGTTDPRPATRDRSRSG